MKVLDWIVIVLIVIGALNWGLIGFFGFNLVHALVQHHIVERAVYALVGLAGLYEIIVHWICHCGCCHTGKRKK